MLIGLLIVIPIFFIVNNISKKSRIIKVSLHQRFRDVNRHISEMCRNVFGALLPFCRYV
nr:MAG TPA_asm: hypothetical protein [Caudoviricetes sp.]